MVAPLCFTCGHPIAHGAGRMFQHDTCRKRAAAAPAWRLRRDWRGRLIVQRKLAFGRYEDAQSLEDIAALLALDGFRPIGSGIVTDDGRAGPIVSQQEEP